MDKPDITSYSILDLLSWQETGTLEVSPKFQRRSVWKTPAKSFFIDSVLQGYPIPPIHIRMAKGKSGKLVREVIDGQQRIRAVFDFVAGKYRIAPSVSAAFGGKTFDTLTEDQRDTINEFSFTVYQYKSLNDADVLDMFARLNTYSEQLSAQELRNGKWFGAFKRTSYQLASESLEFWRKHGIVTELQIARMREVELVSELLAVTLDGMQDGKKWIESYYENLDEAWGSKPVTWTLAGRTVPADYRSAADARQRVSQTLTIIDDAVGDILRQTPLRRQPLFYTLFCATYHVQHGLPRNTTLPMDGRGMTKSRSNAFREVVEELTDVFEEKGRTSNKLLTKFYENSARQTDNILPRQARLEAFLDLVQAV